MSEVTRILLRIESGDPGAAEQLLPFVYRELRNLAAAKMSQEASDHTLQATALVHEAYLRLVDTTHPQVWKSRGHFFAAAAESMRRILVEWARRRDTEKRGGGVIHQPLDERRTPSSVDTDQLLEIHEALDALSAKDQQTAELVKLRYFAGLSMSETAEILGISVRKAHYIWAYARSWFRSELSNASD